MFPNNQSMVMNRFEKPKTLGEIGMGMYQTGKDIGAISKNMNEMLYKMRQPKPASTDMGMRKPAIVRPQVLLNSIDSKPNLPSYRSAIHEGLTNKWQGATDIARIPQAYSNTQPMPSPNKVISPMPTPQ